jgi:oligoribonuclease NrnB/cAMP/cGMP phosphodiesterase (DHH superfamily)
MPKDSSKKIIVIYHASCPDGFGAAWAAWKKFGNRAEYCAVKHADKPLDLRGKEVYFLDLVYKPEVMKPIVKQALKVTVIDHHVTAKDSVALAHESLYDMNHSGAYLAWKYFHPGKAVPKMLLHIEDEDLWKFKLAGTKAVNARLELLNFDFKEFDKAVRDFDKPLLRKKFTEEGNLLAAYRTRVVNRLISENAAVAKFAGYRTLVVNAPQPFGSEIGNALCKALPPIGVVWQERGGSIKVSLRSNGTVDVSKIAQRFGGGGHKSSAGFSLPFGSKQPWTYEKSAKKK